MFSASIVTLDQRAAFMDLLAHGSGTVARELGEQPAASPTSRRQIVMVRANRVIRRTTAGPVAQVADAVAVNLAALAAAFAERLEQDGGMAVTTQQCEQYAGALALGAPRSRRSLYYMTREIFVTEAGQLTTFNDLFAEVFGEPAGADRYREQAPVHSAAAV